MHRVVFLYTRPASQGALAEAIEGAVVPAIKGSGLAAQGAWKVVESVFAEGGAVELWFDSEAVAEQVLAGEVGRRVLETIRSAPAEVTELRGSVAEETLFHISSQRIA